MHLAEKNRKKTTIGTASYYFRIALSIFPKLLGASVIFFQTLHNLETVRHDHWIDTWGSLYFVNEISLVYGIFFVKLQHCIKVTALVSVVEVGKWFLL